MIALSVFLYCVGPHGRLQAQHRGSNDILIDFEHYHYGVPPSEFVYDATGPHGPVRIANRPLWRTYVDLFAPSPKYVMIQASNLTKPDHFPIALFQGVAVVNLRLSVYLKLIDGRLERSAGLLWRVRDKDNYYAVLANARDNRLHLLAMKQGQPVEIAVSPISIGVVYERRTPSPSWGWYALQVETEGNRIAVRFQGEKRIEIDDDVFSGPGQVGLITHADTVAMFDDFYIQIGAVPHSRLPRPAPNRPVPPVMHVAKLFTTGAAFHNPMTTFRRGQPVYWKSVVKDKNGAPVAAAVILVDLLRPDGSRLGTEKRTTGTYGQALFTHQIPATEPPGAYTLRVRSVTHADFVDASYAPAANVISSIAFHVE